MGEITDIEKQYMSEEEKVGLLRKRSWWLKYAKKPWICEICHIEIFIGNKPKHLNTKKHPKNVLIAENMPFT